MPPTKWGGGTWCLLEMGLQNWVLIGNEKADPWYELEIERNWVPLGNKVMVLGATRKYGSRTGWELKMWC